MIDKENNIKFWLWIVIAILVVVILFTGFWQLNRFWHPIPSTAAEFGDSFGAVNSLFSALAFAFLIVTALMQKKELEYQRKELKETRLQLKRSASAQEASERSFKLQTKLMAFQSLLGSYQSLYEANKKIYGESKNPDPRIKEKAKAMASLYLGKIENLTVEMEKEQDLYQGFLNLKSGSMKNFDESTTDPDIFFF